MPPRRRRPQTLTIAILPAHRSQPQTPGAPRAARPSFSAPERASASREPPGRQRSRETGRRRRRGARLRERPDGRLSRHPACGDGRRCAVSARARPCGLSSGPSSTTTDPGGQPAAAVARRRSTAPATARAARTTWSPSRTPSATPGRATAATTTSRRTAATSAAMPARSRPTGRPVNWTSGPPAGGRVLPNLLRAADVTRRRLRARRVFEFDTSDRISQGPLRLRRRAGHRLRQLPLRRRRRQRRQGVHEDSRRRSTRRAPTARQLPGFPTSVGQDGDIFGKDYTWQNGELSVAIGQRDGRRPRRSPCASTPRRDDRLGQPPRRRRGPRDALHATTASAASRRSRRPPPTELQDVRLLRGTERDDRLPRRGAAQACPVAPTNAAHDVAALRVRRPRAHRRERAASARRRGRQAVHALRRAGQRVLRLGVGAGRDVRNGRRPISRRPASSPAAALATARPSAAPGTYRLCFDPFGRPQQVVGAKHSSLADGGPHGRASPVQRHAGDDVRPTASTRTFANLRAGDLRVRRTQPDHRHAPKRRVRPHRRGSREPTGDVTTLRLRRQRQADDRRPGRPGPDVRATTRTDSCAPRRRPRAARSRYDSIGSLGNVRQETRPGGARRHAHVRLRRADPRGGRRRPEVRRQLLRRRGRPAWTEAPGPREARIRAGS